MATLAESDQTKVMDAIQKVSQIAALPEVTAKIVQVVEDPRSSAKDLHDIIRNDVALSAKILKVVNSAFYGLPRQVGSVDRAIVLLGLSTVKNIAIATSISKLFKGAKLATNFTAKDLWRHSLACGVFCKLIAHHKGVENCDEVFVAGLMHDIGIIVEMQVFPTQLGEVIDKVASSGRPLCQIELETFGADHQAFGTGLASKWKFPFLFQLATGYHHDPMRAAEQHREVACTVYLADVLACVKGIGIQSQESMECNDDVLAYLGMDEAKIHEILEEFDAKFSAADGALGAN
jgi:HD-like signal output (HDOD) protein